MQLANHTNERKAILTFCVITDLLFLPVTWSFYTALKELKKSIMLAGISLLVLFVVLDLAVTWPNYAAAVNEAQQIAVFTAANDPHEVSTSTSFGVYTILLPALVINEKRRFQQNYGLFGYCYRYCRAHICVWPAFAFCFRHGRLITSVLTVVWILFAGCDLLRINAMKNDH